MIKSANDLIRIIISLYCDKPDDFVVSVGHWVAGPCKDQRNVVVAMEYFSAEIKLTVGNLRELMASSIER